MIATDVSEQLIGPIFLGWSSPKKNVFFLDCFTIESLGR